MANSAAAMLAKMAAQCLQLAADLEAQETPAPSGVSVSDAPLPASELIRLRPGVSAGWLKNNVVAVGRGARQRPMYLLCDVDAALAASPVQVRAKRIRPKADIADPLEALIASGAVVRGDR